MKRWGALVCVLVLTTLIPRLAASQSTSTKPRDRSSGLSLGQNFPNPFNPETRIPFAVANPPACTDSGKQHHVTLRVYNLLAQLVAVPVLQGGEGGGQPIQGMTLGCGEYTAYWDGKYIGTSREVASGVYLYRLEVDGRAVVRKMIVAK